VNLSSIESQVFIDPLFKQTTQKFDEMGQGSLLGSRLNVTPHLLLQLDSQMPYCKHDDGDQLESEKVGNNKSEYSQGFSQYFST
jgi:hypothetical protein